MLKLTPNRQQISAIQSENFLVFYKNPKNQHNEAGHSHSMTKSDRSGKIIKASRSSFLFLHSGVISSVGFFFFHIVTKCKIKKGEKGVLRCYYQQFDNKNPQSCIT